MLFVLFVLLIFPLVSSAALGPDCNNGFHVSFGCCSASYISQTVRVADVDTIFIAPYSCANPGYCMHMAIAAEKMQGEPAADVGLSDAAHPTPSSGSKAGWWEYDNPYFSGESRACAPVDLIACKLGKYDNESAIATAACYAASHDPTVTVYFTKSFACVTRVVGNDTVIDIGSCTILFGTDWRPTLDSRDLLATPFPRDFAPILSPDAVPSLLWQRSLINRVLLRSDIVPATAYLPEYSLRSHSATVYARIGEHFASVAGRLDALEKNATEVMEKVDGGGSFLSFLGGPGVVLMFLMIFSLLWSVERKLDRAGKRIAELENARTNVYVSQYPPERLTQANESLGSLYNDPLVTLDKDGV